MSKTKLTFDYHATASETVHITSGGSWEFKNVPSWITVQPSSGSGSADVEIAVNSDNNNFNAATAILNVMANGTALYDTIIQKGNPAYDPAHWEITVSSEQSGEGVGADAIDQDFGTYWTAQWDPNDLGRPDTLTINMKQKLKVNSFYFRQRKNVNLNLNSNLNKVHIYVSNSGQSNDWTPLENKDDKSFFELDVDGGKNTQSLAITEQSFQYFRIIILKQEDVGIVDGNSSTPALADVWVGNSRK